MPEMIATEDHQIAVTETELVDLLQDGAEHGYHVDLVFGPGWAALTWAKGTAIPAAVRRLGLLRGVLNQNCQGARI